MKWRRPKVSEKYPDMMPQVAICGFWLRNQNVVKFPQGKSSLSQKMFTCCLREKSLRDRHPLCGKMGTQKLLNVPLYPRGAPREDHVVRFLHGVARVGHEML